MLGEALAIDTGPSAVRWPKTAARQVPADQVGSGLRARKVRSSDEGEVCILAVGKMVAAAEQAAELLDDSGAAATVWDVRVVKPLDPAMLADAARYRLVVTVEDGIVVGGIGSQIAEAVAALDEGRQGPPVLVLGIPATFLPHGKPDQILAELGLDAPGIAAATAKALAAQNLSVD
jgi:1-deoxy-D-xylulose-5-phosphate synthase